MVNKGGEDKIYEKQMMDHGEKSPGEGTTPLNASSFFKVNERFLGGTSRLRNVPRLVQKYGQAMWIAPQDFRAYTKYERNRAIVRLSLNRINNEEHLYTESLL